MSRNICFIAFGTFGNPNGFKQTFFIGGTPELAKSIKTFDLKTDAIKLFPKSKIYSVRKESVTGHKAVSYSLYTYAKEQNSDRGGTFVGSGILYLDAIAEESDTLRSLNEFHDTLVGKNVQHDVIAVNHSDKFMVSKPVSYEKLETGGRDIGDIDFNQSFNKSLVVYCEVNAARLPYLFKKALDLLNVFDTIYFTSNAEVAEFVHQKNLFQLVQADGFEKELLKLQAERQQYIQGLVTDYEGERQKLAEDKDRVLAEWKEQIDANENINQKNKASLDKARQDYSQLAQTYEGYEKSIGNAVAQLQAGKKPDAVRRLHLENKRIFIDSVNEQKKPGFISTLSKPKVQTNVKPGFQQESYAPAAATPGNHRQRRRSGRRVSRFKIASLVLLLLWIGTLAYFLFFTHTNQEIAVLPQPKMQAPADTPTAPKPTAPALNPKPNATLAITELRSVIKAMKPHASVTDVVNTIFDKNPETIRKVYAFQKEDYKQYLLEQNADYFEKKDSSLYLKSDTLGVIPSYKAQP